MRRAVSGDIMNFSEFFPVELIGEIFNLVVDPRHSVPNSPPGDGAQRLEVLKPPISSSLHSIAPIKP